MAEQEPMNYAEQRAEPGRGGLERGNALRPLRPASVGFVKLSTGNSSDSIARLPEISPHLAYDRHDRIIRAQAELLGTLEEPDSEQSRRYQALRPALYESSEIGRVVWRVWWDDPVSGVNVQELSYDPKTHQYEGTVEGRDHTSYDRNPFLREIETRLQASANKLHQDPPLDRIVEP